MALQGTGSLMCKLQPVRFAELLCIVLQCFI
jgi:hypothetical protein